MENNDNRVDAYDIGIAVLMIGLLLAMFYVNC